MEYVTDNFGNRIEAGDYVLYSGVAWLGKIYRHGVIRRAKVTRVCKKSVFVETENGEVNVFLDCVVRDNSDEMKELEERDRFLSCLEACGVDNWGDYYVAQQMFAEENGEE